MKKEKPPRTIDVSLDSYLNEVIADQLGNGPVSEKQLVLSVQNALAELPATAIRKHVHRRLEDRIHLGTHVKTGNGRYKRNENFAVDRSTDTGSGMDGVLTERERKEMLPRT